MTEQTGRITPAEREGAQDQADRDHAYALDSHYVIQQQPEREADLEAGQ